MKRVREANVTKETGAANEMKKAKKMKRISAAKLRSTTGATTDSILPAAAAVSLR